MSGSARRRPVRVPKEEPNLQILPARVWGVLVGLFLAGTACLFGLIGIFTGWEVVPGLPYLYNGLLALSLILAFLMLPVAWRQLPEGPRRRLLQVGRSRSVPAEMDPPPWMLPGPEVCRLLHVSSHHGLAYAAVKQRLKRHGHNDLEASLLPSFPFFAIDKIYSPLRLLSLFLVVLYAGLVNLEEAVVASVALVALLLLDLWAEWRSQQAFARMRSGVPREALVLRDGTAMRVDRRLLVPGDIVLLRAGMEVPADLRLLNTSLLEIDESRLSGEWDSVACRKDANTLGATGGSSSNLGPLGQGRAVSCLDLPSVALAGSIVVNGRGAGVVFRTGHQTELGKKNTALAAAKDAGPRRGETVAGKFSSLVGGPDWGFRGQGSALGPVSESEVTLGGAAWRCSLAAVAVCLLSALLGGLRGEPWQDIVLCVFTLFFAAVPKHLPVVLVAALGLGSRPLQRHEVFAQGLRAVESLGCVDTLVVDKMGSVTEPKLILSSALVAATAVGPDDLMEATREVPKSGPLAQEGGLEALGSLLEAWIMMSDMGDDLLQDVKPTPKSLDDAPGADEEEEGVGEEGVGEEGEGEEEEEEGADGGDEEGADVPMTEDTSGLLSDPVSTDAESYITARGGVVDPIDAAMLSAVGGPAVFTQLPYEGMDGGDAAPTRGLRPLHDMLKRLYEAKLEARLAGETLFESTARPSFRTFRGVAVKALPVSAQTKTKSVQEKLLALGKRVAGQNGAQEHVGSPSKSDPAPSAPRTRMYVRGAPEMLVAQCTKILQNGEEVPLAPFRAQLLEKIQALAAEGLVVVGYASGDVAGEEADGDSPGGSIASCTFLGVLALLNPILPGVKATVVACRKAGVRVLLVTGDNPGTAEYVAQAMGIAHPHQSTDVEVPQQSASVSCLERPPAQSTGDELAELLQSCSVFSRATPTDRLCIVEALHALTTGQGNCVAVCGTGHMDAPVLASADLGLALGKAAADVCRDSAGLVAMDKPLPLITLSLREGRRLTENARKAVAVSLGCKMALLLVFLVATAWARFPFSPMQLAVLAVFLNVGVMYAYIDEPIDCDTFTRAPRRPNQPFFDLPLLLTVACAASSIAISVLLVFALALHVLGAHAELPSMAFITCLLSTSLVALNLRTSREPVLHKGLFTNPWVLAWVAAAAAWCAAISQPWALHRALRLETMGVSLWLIVLGVCLAGAFWMEVSKGILWFYTQRGYALPDWDEDHALAVVTGAGDVQLSSATERGAAPLLPAGVQQSDADVESGH